MSYHHANRYSFDDDEEAHFNEPGQPYVSRAPSIDSLPDFDPTPPPPPPHRTHPAQQPGTNFGQLQAQRSYASSGSQRAAYQPAPQNPRRPSFTTPGTDNLGTTAAGGGIAGVALDVANTNNRQSGLDALRDVDTMAYSRSNVPPDADLGNRDPSPYGYDGAADGEQVYQMSSYGSSNHTENPFESRPSLNAYSSHDGYSSEDPYQQYSSPNRGKGLGAIDPSAIDDDGDDGLATAPREKRKTMFGRKSMAGAGAGAAGAGAAAGVYLAHGSGGANYGPVPGNGGANDYNAGLEGEKSEWLSRQKSGNKRLRLIIGTLIGILIVGAIAGAIVGGILGSHSAANSQPETAAEDDSKGDLSKDSPEIQKLMNNPNLHRVFPGMDYTPLNAQYPDCLTNPPSQNNVTRDMAVISQLAPTVRLYGTDCNQTEMILHSIDRLGLTDQKVWMGAWLGNNDTTNTRQLSQMWDVLDKHGGDPFAGLIVGNEVLYRKDLSATELGDILGDVRTNLSSRNLDLPLATSDLGDNWTAALAKEVDVIMANIHPFFAGVTAAQAASWTWTFWQENDVVVTENLQGKKHVISETGWPSGGGNDCGTGDKCTSDTAGSVAGIDEMNAFMDGWVCDALTNGTVYFWFETFDEPWKVMYNSGDENWEDKWGLMDSNRNLKSGVKIPDCGGATWSSTAP